MISRRAASICWTTRGSRSSFWSLGLLQREFLVDQALEHLPARRRGLLGRQGALLGEHEVDLVDGDLFLVHLGRGLGRGLVLLLVAAADQQRRGGDQQQGERERRPTAAGRDRDGKNRHRHGQVSLVASAHASAPEQDPGVYCARLSGPGAARAKVPGARGLGASRAPPPPERGAPARLGAMASANAQGRAPAEAIENR